MSDRNKNLRRSLQGSTSVLSWRCYLYSSKLSIFHLPLSRIRDSEQGLLLGGKMNGNNIEVRGSERILPQNKQINSGNTTQTHVDVDVSQWP